MATDSLSNQQIEAALAELNDWQLQSGKLHKMFDFGSFVEAFAFMTKVALAAEKADHHPDWSNVYRTVRIDLVTHSAGGITQKDVDLATVIDSFL